MGFGCTNPAFCDVALAEACALGGTVTSGVASAFSLAGFVALAEAGALGGVVASGAASVFSPAGGVALADATVVAVEVSITGAGTSVATATSCTTAGLTGDSFDCFCSLVATSLGFFLGEARTGPW